MSLICVFSIVYMFIIHNLHHASKTSILLYRYKRTQTCVRKIITKKLLIANSYFTANAIKEAMKVDTKVLYPPILTSFLRLRAAN